MTDHDKQTTLAAEVVVGRLWETAPVHAVCRPLGRIASGPAFDAVYLHGANGGTFANDHHGIRCVHTEGKRESWSLSLRLPGPHGLGLEGLKRRVKARTKWWVDQQDPAQPSPMPDWFNEVFEGAAIDDCGVWAWLSRYHVMTDALAAKLGWPTGPGAPVYTFRGVGTTWHLAKHGEKPIAKYASVPYKDPGVNITVPALDGIFDPMEALEVAWTRECAI